MKSTRTACVALAAAALLSACENTAELLPVTDPSAGAMFRSYVAIGNSITAGWQSGGINDSTQRESYALYLAQQVGLTVGPTMASDFVYPSFPITGCPAPVTNVLTQARLGAPNNPPCTLRAESPELVHNVSVPGATVADPTTTAGNTTSSAINQFILGGRTQVDRALMADPTFASIWIGNNDVLSAAISGVLTAVPGVSPGVTSQANFTQRFDAIVTQLTGRAPDVEGVMIAVLQVSNSPALFPAALLFNATVKAAFDQAAGGVTTLLPTCTPTTTSLISFQITATYRALPAGAPRPISCDKSTATPQNSLLGEVFVLDAQDIAALTALINAYNTHIQQQATQLGWAYFDPNPTLTQLKANGSIPAFPNLADPANPFGQYVSLDGVHPRRAGHVLVANGVIDAVNAKYGTTIPKVDVATTGSRPVQVTTSTP